MHDEQLQRRHVMTQPRTGYLINVAISLAAALEPIAVPFARVLSFLQCHLSVLLLTAVRVVGAIALVVARRAREIGPAEVLPTRLPMPKIQRGHYA